MAQPVGDGTVGPVVRRLFDIFARHVKGDLRKRPAWTAALLGRGPFSGTGTTPWSMAGRDRGRAERRLRRAWLPGMDAGGGEGPGPPVAARDLPGDLRRRLGSRAGHLLCRGPRPPPGGADPDARRGGGRRGGDRSRAAAGVISNKQGAAAAGGGGASRLGGAVPILVGAGDAEADKPRSGARSGWRWRRSACRRGRRSGMSGTPRSTCRRRGMRAAPRCCWATRRMMAGLPVRRRTLHFPPPWRSLPICGAKRRANAPGEARAFAMRPGGLWHPLQSVHQHWMVAAFSGCNPLRCAT